MSIGEVEKVFLQIDSVLTEMLSCKQAAYHYNFHHRTIRKWAEEGKIKAIEFEGRWWIAKIDLEAFLKRNDHK